MEYLKELKEMGQDPQALRDRPTLDGYLTYYVDSFIEVKDSRGFSANGEPLPLATSEIVAHCELYGITSLAERERLARMLRSMDMTYRKVAAEQAEQRSANKSTS